MDGRRVSTVRAIDIGNFNRMNSDSVLQLAVFERIRSLLGMPEAFYQEPRCSKGEEQYLQDHNVAVLPCDDLTTFNPKLRPFMNKSEGELHFIYMIHFDNYGINNLLKAYKSVGMEKNLIIMGNEVPVDLVDKMSEDFKNMKKVPMGFRRPKLNFLTSEFVKSWNRAFAHTCFYYFDKDIY